jgi:tRNA modification GTPase
VAADGTSGATIYALASAQGRAGVAVLRLSGPGAGDALRALTGRPLPSPRQATLARFRDPATGEEIDRGLALWFRGPASFTGEDVVELHLHGGRAVIAGAIEALGRLPGLRPAEAGEFARRAFLAGKLDLTAAEGLADLVAAETAAQRRQALRQLGGALQRLYEGWRSRLVRSLAHLEAVIDFPEEDLPGDVATGIRREILCLSQEIRQHLDDAGRGERLRDGLSVAIIGAPNVGKSSLLNALARREAAIVSATAGTTRDVVEVAMDLQGYPLTLADTAGLRASGDEIEREGVRRALARAEAADLKIAVFDATRWPELEAATAGLVDEDTVVVLNKADLAGPLEDASMFGRPALRLSARTGAGVGALLDRLGSEAAARMAAGAAPALTRERHRRALEDCVAALERSLAAPLPELAAEDVRLAARALGRITGRVAVDDLLDVIFREFCIGK